MPARNPKLPTGYGQSTRDPGLPLDVLDGNVQVKANAAGMKARAAAWTLITKAADLRKAGHDGEARALLEAAQDLLEEMFRWKDAWVSVKVDGERQAREAAAESVSCEAHGREIQELRRQVWFWERTAERTEAARLVLLSWYQTCADLIRSIDSRGVAVKHPTGETLAKWLRTETPRVHRAHQRVFTKPIPELPADN